LLSKDNGVEEIATGTRPAKINVNVRYLIIELSNRRAVFAAVLEASPTHIIHAAAIADINLCEKVPRALLEKQCRSIGKYH